MGVLKGMELGRIGRVHQVQRRGVKPVDTDFPVGCGCGNEGVSVWEGSMGRKV